MTRDRSQTATSPSPISHYALDFMKSPSARANSLPIISAHSFSVKELSGLPHIHDFSVPRKVMMRRVERSFEDIEEAFKANHISANITDALRDFGDEEKWIEDLSFSAVRHG